jgi:hypothetical protein
VDTEGRREIVGLGIGPSEAEPFWSRFIKGLMWRPGKGRFLSNVKNLLPTRPAPTSTQRATQHLVVAGRDHLGETPSAIPPVPASSSFALRPSPEVPEILISARNRRRLLGDHHS